MAAGTHPRRLVAASVVAALLPFAAAGTASASTTRATLDVHTTSKHVVVIATSTVPGVAAIRNTGTETVFLARSRGAAGEADFVRDFNSTKPTGMARDFVLVARIGGPRTAYAKLTAGRYFVAPSNARAATTDNVAALTVSGRAVDAPLPRATAVSLDVHGTMRTAGTLSRTGFLHITNASAQYQEVLLGAPKKGLSKKAIDDFIAHPSLKRIFDVNSTIYAVAYLDVKQGIYENLRFRAGRYLLFTVTTDRRSGAFSVRSGQVRAVTLS